MKTRKTGKGAIVFLLALGMAVACMSAPAFAAPDAGQDQLPDKTGITATSDQGAPNAGAPAESTGAPLALQAAEIVAVSSWQSLQDAINNNANSGKTIQLAGNINANGKNYLNVSGKTVTIDLNGKELNRGRTSSDSDGHVFWVRNNGNLTIVDSVGGGKITGGWANNGGGINIQEGSVCTIAGGTITGNKAEDSGGGVLVRGKLIMTGGTISDNKAKTGGGLFCTDKATEVSLKNVTISGNKSSGNGAGIDTHAAMTIEECVIDNNENTSTDSGGGIYADASGKTVEIKNSRLSNNKAKNDGGGIRAHRGTVKMTGGSIVGCSAGRDGGGVYITDEAVFDASDTHIAQNSCSNSGGGICADGKLTMNGGFISENSAKGAGGGIFCDTDATDVTLTNVVIDKNEAKDGTNGGGIDTHVPMTIDGCSIRDNKSGDNGGGLYVDAASKTVTIKNNTDFAGNFAADDGGGIYIMRGTVDMTGGSVTGSSADDGGGVYVTSNTKFTANDVSICENKTTVHDGAGILNKGEMTLTNCEVSANTAKRHAGGIWNNASGTTTTIKNTHIDGNTAEEDSGGGIYLEAGTIQMTDGSVSGNKSEDGGGLFITSNTTFSAEGTQINKNESTELDGGGLVCKSVFTLTGCEVSENKAKVSGGGIWYNASSKATIKNTQIDGNEVSENGGGGIYIQDGQIEMTGGTISGNKAPDGAGVFVLKHSADKDSDGDFAADGTTFSHNASTNEDGGAVMNKGAITLRNCTIDSNSSVMHGGGVYSNADTGNVDNDVVIENTSFTNNVSGEGGAIYVKDGDMMLRSNAEGETLTFTGNGAGSGGAIFVHDDADAFLEGSSGFEFSKNFAKVDGGAIYNDGNLKMANSVKISENKVSDGNGTGIYQIGGLWVKDKPNISDEIFLAQDKTVKVDGSLNDSAVIKVAAEVVERKITENYKSNTGKTELKFFEPASNKYALNYVSDGDNGEIYIKDGAQDFSDAELVPGDALNGVTVKLRPSGSDLAACVKYSKEKIQLDTSKVPDADDVIDELRIDYNPVKDKRQDGDNKHADRNGDRWYLQKAGDNCYRFLYYVRTRDAMPSQNYVLGLKGDLVYVSEKNDASADQKWEIYKLPDSTYIIKNVGKNKYWSADELDDLNAADRDKTEVRLREAPLTWWMEVVNKKVQSNGKWVNSSNEVYNGIADTYDTYNQVTLDSKGKKVRSHDWMSHLPDDLYFTDINIPSSHDTSAFNVDDATIKRCQQYYLDELLNQGLRGLDIRIGDWDGDYGSFKIVHSYSDIYKADGNKLYLEDILQMTFDFLDKNPTEFFLFKFQPDIHEDDNAPLIYMYLKNLVTDPQYKDRIYFFNSLDDVPTIGELRGKLLLHYDCMDEMDELEASDIDDLKDDVNKYAKKSDKFSTIANIDQLKNENDWWRVNGDNDPETEYWVYDFVETENDDPGWNPKGDGEFCGRTISRKTIELWHENNTSQTPFGDPVESPNIFDGQWWSHKWGNKWRDMKNDLISQYSAYHLKQNVESRGKKAWIKLTNYCTKCPFAYPTWSAHELHPVLLELLHSGEFMTAHDGFAGECRFNFADKNLVWSTYRLNFMRNSSYEQLQRCVPGEPVKENEIEPTCTAEGSYDLVTKCTSHDEEVEVSRNHVTVKPLGHDWDDGKLTKPATQFDAGVITYTCKRDGCGATKTVAISPTHAEHEWGEVEYAWEEDGSKVKASRSCTVCGLMESETAVLDESGTGGPGKVTKEVTKQATCEEAGKATYTAEFENSSVFQSASVELEDNPALGHEWEKDGDASVEPSCEAEGKTVYRCKRGCGETIEKTLPALDHEWPDDHDPDFVEVKNKVEPTCESEGGYTEVYKCKRCGTPLTEVGFVIAALGHDWGEWKLVEASGDTPAHYKRVCNNDSTHFECKDAEPPAVADLTEVAEVPATCTQAGTMKHWEYKVGGGEAQAGDETQGGFADRYFVQMEEDDTTTPDITLDDGTKLKEVDKEDLVIPALGHQWGEITYAWSDNGQSVTASRDCVREGCTGMDGAPAREEETASVEQGTIAAEVDRPASCTEPGSHLYTPTFSNQDFEKSKDTKTVEDIPTVSHDWTSPTYDWADDYSAVTATRKCRNCSETETETASQENGRITKETVEEASVTATGKTAYTANFENTAFERQVKTEIIPMVNPGTDTQDDPEVPVEAFTVTFVDGQGNMLKTATVEKGNAATPPDNPTREGYTFDGWDTDFSNVTSDLTVKAKWKENPAPEPGSDPNQMGIDGTPVGLGASAAAADRAITSMTADKDLEGSVFSKLAPRSLKQKKASINLKWSKVDKAKKYVIYGNKCSNKNAPKKLVTVTGNATVFKTIAGMKLKKGTYYKFIIVALDENNNVVSTSKLLHVATKGGKVGNHKKVTVKKAVITKAKKLKKGKSLRIKAKAVPQSKKLKVKKHVAVRYESTDNSIATVSKKGVVKAKSKGTCYVYAFAQDGAFKKIKVAVR